MKLKTKTEKETKELAKKVAENIISKDKNKATVLALKGDLGSGKTTFSKGFAEYFGVERVTSPTFVIMKIYDIDKSGFKKLYHFDCYRLEKEGLGEIKMDEIINDNKNIVLIEWPEKIKEDIKDSLELNFKVVQEKKREIEIPDEIGLKK